MLFQLRWLKFKLVGKSGFINGGVQFRSQPATNPPNEMIGYQADMGQHYWGCLYDERRHKLLTGPPADTIADFAEEKGADMIIVGTHGRKGLARVFLGSTAESLLREAPCQVLVVKPKHSTEAAHESLETVEAES